MRLYLRKRCEREQADNTLEKGGRVVWMVRTGRTVVGGGRYLKMYGEKCFVVIMVHRMWGEKWVIVIMHRIPASALFRVSTPSLNHPRQMLIAETSVGVRWLPGVVYSAINRISQQMSICSYHVCPLHGNGRYEKSISFCSGS